MNRLISAVIVLVCIGNIQAQNRRSELWNNVSYHGFRGEFDKAIQHMDTIISMGDNLANNYAYRGLLNQKGGDHKAAILDFDKSLSLDSKVYQAYLNRGKSKLLMEEYKGAIADFDKVIGKDLMYDSIAYRYRGQAYHHSGQYEAALKDYNEALKYNQRDLDLITSKSAVYMALEENEKAVDLIQMALKIEPNYINASQVNSVIGTGEAQSLKRLLQLALDYQRFHKDDAQNNLNIGYLYMKFKQPGNALKHLNAIEGELANTYEVYFNKAMAYYYSLDNTRAIENFNLAITKKPDMGRPYLYLADSYKMLGNKDKACESLGKAAALGVLGAQEVMDARCK